MAPTRSSGTGKAPRRASLYAAERETPRMSAAVVRSVVGPSARRRSAVQALRLDIGVRTIGDVSTVEELDAALDEATDPSRPRVVGIYPPEHLGSEASPWDEPMPPALQIGVGHPDRAFALWLGPHGGIGVDPSADPWTDGAEDIAFDYGGDPVFVGCGEGPRQRQSGENSGPRLATGQRPTCLDWVDN